MTNPMLVRFHDVKNQGARLGCIVGDELFDLHPFYLTVHEWLKGSVGRAAQLIQYLESLPEKSATRYPVSMLQNALDPDTPHLLVPVDMQEVWAAGVTYERSREARQEEAVDGGDVYARVYAAERPELFFKSSGRKVVGPFGEVGIREDATWSVPEPELGMVMNSAMEVVGFTVGNDMSSRDIEGVNPLYLPQAKVYTASCALGPGILLSPSTEWPQTTIRMSIERDGRGVFEGDIHTSKIHRKMSDLVEYLGRSNLFPDGVVLLTGTGIVPSNDFTLQAGDVITVTIDGIGTLTNTVKVV